MHTQFEEKDKFRNPGGIFQFKLRRARKVWGSVGRECESDIYCLGKLNNIGDHPLAGEVHLVCFGEREIRPRIWVSEFHWYLFHYLHYNH